MTTDRPALREIITKAVCGAGTCTYQRSIDLEVPVNNNIQVLGHFVSNADIEQASVVDHNKYGKSVQVRGRYNVHVWYAYDQDTQAAKTTVTFIEHIPIKMYGGESKALEPLVHIIQKPRCNKAYVKNLTDKSVIRVEIEQTLGTEVSGTTTLKIGVIPAAMSAIEPVIGKELVPPEKYTPQYAVPDPNYFDLKCEEDLPEEDDDYSFFYDEYTR